MIKLLKLISEIKVIKPITPEEIMELYKEVHKTTRGYPSHTYEQILEIVKKLSQHERIKFYRDLLLLKQFHKDNPNFFNNHNNELDEIEASQIEEPSHYDNEDEAIEKYIDSVKETYPEGITTTEFFNDIVDEPFYDARIQLKIMIELAKEKLLKLGQSKMIITPQDVLAIYGNPKHTLDKANFNWNE
ncbi:MAG TPA: hypothetical protein VFV86_06980 [Nitrososphaeraceae archaeon]|nr:hypothetical protein [Nitrososphaeraceae archaeon]